MAAAMSERDAPAAGFAAEGMVGDGGVAAAGGCDGVAGGGVAATGGVVVVVADCGVAGCEAAAGVGGTGCTGAAGAAGGMGRRVEDAVSGETNKVSLYSSSTMKSCNWMLLRLIIRARKF